MRPVVDIVMPASLAGQTNGKLDPSLLVAIDDQGHVLEAHAALAWADLAEAAERDGVTLTADTAYRSYDRQVELFTTRYSRTPQPATKPTMWGDVAYWKLPAAITAAVPGTSNHGWGLAVDVHTDRTNVAWLEQHEVDHGFSHEASISETEPWHIHYFAGDRPPAVAQPTPEDDMQWRILAPAGSAAKFIAPMAPLPNGQLAALYATWLPTGAHADEWLSRGATFLELGVEDLRNVVLLGPLPTGDARVWSAADWLAVA